MIIRTVLSTGSSLILYGEGGVGKTSLLNITKKELIENADLKIINYSCSEGDTYKDIFYEFLKQSNQLYEELPMSIGKKNTLKATVSYLFLKGGLESETDKRIDIKSRLDSSLTPYTIASQFCNNNFLFVIDEANRISSSDTKALLADTIKKLSDTHSRTKIILTGMSDDASTLIGKNPAIIRNIVTLHIKRMKKDELRQIIQKGCEELKLNFSDELKELIIVASTGLPYFVHLIARELAFWALQKKY